MIRINDESPKFTAEISRSTINVHEWIGNGWAIPTNATVRTVFLIGPDKNIKLILSYPMSTGSNFDEGPASPRFDAA
jgi:alkyl hydroperoxide reductase subunit AhpC